MELKIEIVRNIELDEFFFDGQCVVFREGADIVGYASLDTYDKGAPIVYIYQIEMVIQGQGYGRGAMHLLRQHFGKDTVFQGIALSTSVSFWATQGAQFFETCEKCPLLDSIECPIVVSNTVCDDYNEFEFEL